MKFVPEVVVHIVRARVPNSLPSGRTPVAAEQTALENLARDVAGRMATQIALTLRKDQ